jgi:hypothetical protein
MNIFVKEFVAGLGVCGMRKDEEGCGKKDGDFHGMNGVLFGDLAGRIIPHTPTAPVCKFRCISSSMDTARGEFFKAARGVEYITERKVIPISFQLQYIGLDEEHRR